MCDTPYYKRIDGYIEELPLPCGKCPPCKMRRVNDWVFRLEQESLVSSSSYFITLTYDTRKVPISPNGFMSLNKRDYQLFMKRLRKLDRKSKLRYYAVGEYGTKTNRPHYHAILFNLDKMEKINEAWQLGAVHIGNVRPESIAYTCKYIDKAKRIPMHKNDDRLREFSLMSKGLGANYLKKQNIAWHKRDLTRNYIVKKGNYKIALPKYYRDRIFDDDEKRIQRKNIIIAEREMLKEKEVEIQRKFKGAVELDEQLYKEKMARYQKFYNQSKPRRK